MSANDSEFIGTARGRNLDFAKGWNAAGNAKRGGISSPQEVKIPKGRVLIRIGHSRDESGAKMPDWVNLTSPWWMTDATFLEIAGRSEDAGTPIAQMVRMKLALTPDFGVCDTLFWVVTKQPLRAWHGRGNPVLEDPDPKVRAAKGRPLGWWGGYEVGQNFIPGLRDWAANRPSAAAIDGLAVLPKMPLSAWATIRNGGFAPIPFPFP